MKFAMAQASASPPQPTERAAHFTVGSRWTFENERSALETAMHPEMDAGCAVTVRGTIQFAQPPVTARPMHPIAHIGFEPNDPTLLAPVLTFVGWVVCLAVGLLGFLLPYARPHQSVNPTQSVKVQRLIVELSKEPVAPSETERPPGPGLPCPSRRTPWLRRRLPLHNRLRPSRSRYLWKARRALSHSTRPRMPGHPEGAGGATAHIR